MKKLWIGLLACIAWAGTGCDIVGRKTRQLKGSGKIVTRDVQIAAFDRLDVRSDVQVTIAGGSGAATVEADDNLIDLLRMEVVDGTLRIGLAPGLRIGSFSDHTLKVRLPSDGSLKEINLSGASQLIAEPVLTAPEIELDLSGASKLTATIRCDRCEIDVSGASGAVLGGTAQHCDAEISGASKLALDMECDDLETKCSGASKAKLAGSARTGGIEATGASAIDGGEFTAASCYARASGASHIRIQCSDKLQATASGASKIAYSGTCATTEIHASGASSVSRK